MGKFLSKYFSNFQKCRKLFLKFIFLCIKNIYFESYFTFSVSFGEITNRISLSISQILRRTLLILHYQIHYKLLFSFKFNFLNHFDVKSFNIILMLNHWLVWPMLKEIHLQHQFNITYEISSYIKCDQCCKKFFYNSNSTKHVTSFKKLTFTISLLMYTLLFKCDLP